MAEALAREYPDLHIQTHVAENIAEIAFANELYPNYGDYVGIYEKFHLLGPKTLLGHCIHLTHREMRGDRQHALGGGVLPHLQPVHRLGPVRLRPAARAWRAHRGGDRCGRRQLATRCCGRWTRATRCCSCAASGSTRCARSTMMTLGNARAMALGRPDRQR